MSSYWTEVDRELASLPVAPELEHLPLRSTDFATVYAVRMTSIGPYRIFAYLSVPNGGGPFPGLIETPRYGSVNHVPAYELRQRYAVLTIMHRGQRLADQPFAAAYPGLLTLGIADPKRYAYRGIVADCLRGAEFLLGYPGIDTSRIGILGDDLALITAARRPQFAALQLSGLLFYRLMEAGARTDAYPVEEVNETLRTFPEQREAMTNTLAYFDPVSHAATVTARTLITASDPGSIGGPEWLQPLVDALGDRAEIYRLTHEGRTDHTWLDAWLAGQLIPTAVSA
jgi:cephalosporin-C deacetylase-like acetyl esterase